VKIQSRKVLFRYRLSLGFFILGLTLSGISALPLELESAILDRWFGMNAWITTVHSAIHETYARLPFFGYGTDWLAFGHFVIAAFFILPFVDPVRYRGVLYIGLVACAGVILVALICGPIRDIPFGWQLIDCSFGILGAIPLLYCLRLVQKIERHA